MFQPPSVGGNNSWAYHRLESQKGYEQQRDNPLQQNVDYAYGFSWIV
ncbi:MAG: hypothetical protein HY835_00840 [Anaerolineae bacterium]|nr:hypothetical protein [Anaerolineae bacterium]